MNKTVWEPTDRQKEFLEIPDDVFEVLYGGAAGGGKSELLIWAPGARGFFDYPNFKGIFFRRTFPQLEESIIPRAKLIYGTNGNNGYFNAKYNDTKHVFTFPSGATMRLSYMEKMDDATQHDTAEFNYLAIDELTHFEEDIYRYISSRVRTSSNLPAIMRTGSNPGNIGHIWVRDRFVAPKKDGGALIFDKTTNTYRIFIKSLLTDNPHLLKHDPNYINRLRLLPIADQKAKIYGDWWVFAGQVFSEFRENRYSDEPENALHVIEPFTIPEWWPKIVAIDWGYTHKLAVGWYAISPDERVFKYREYVGSKIKISSWAADIARLSQFDGNIVSKVIDPSADEDRGQDESIFLQVVRETGWRDLEKAANDRIGGKLLLHEMLRWTQKPQRYVPQEGYDPDAAARILRVYGLDATKEYESLFTPEPPEINLPKFQIFNRCPETIKCLPSLIYDEKHVEDVKKVDGDDPYDETRYGLERVHRFIKQAGKLWEERRQLSQIQDDYSRDKDANSYYRRMEYFEAKHKKSIPVSRHRARKVLRANFSR